MQYEYTEEIKFDQATFSNDLQTLDPNLIEPPAGKQGIKVLTRMAKEAIATGNPITIFAGSCPDYSHAGGRYTHDYLNDGVPLLTQQHLAAGTELRRVLSAHGVPFEYVIMLADVEATDQVFADRFTQRSTDDFLARCNASVRATQELLSQSRVECVRASSFFQEFGYETFMNLQVGYVQLLTARYENSEGDNGRFKMRVDTDTLARMNMYRVMYRGYYEELSSTDRFQFYVGRTIRTMAQYLTLGRLIREETAQPVVVNHKTINIGLYNDGNRFKLHDGDRDMSSLPVFTLAKPVY